MRFPLNMYKGMRWKWKINYKWHIIAPKIPFRPFQMSSPRYFMYCLESSVAGDHSKKQACVNIIKNSSSLSELLKLHSFINIVQLLNNILEHDKRRKHVALVRIQETTGHKKHTFLPFWVGSFFNTSKHNKEFKE